MELLCVILTALGVSTAHFRTGACPLSPGSRTLPMPAGGSSLLVPRGCPAWLCMAGVGCLREALPMVSRAREGRVSASGWEEGSETTERNGCWVPEGAGLRHWALGSETPRALHKAWSCSPRGPAPWNLCDLQGPPQ